MNVTEVVELRAYVRCIECLREILFATTLTGESVRTGNTTQTARYNMDALTKAVEAKAEQRTWKKFDAGWRCAHCLAKRNDPIDAQPGVPR